MLLQGKVDVDSRDADGWTPLHAAAHWGQEEVCSLLADHMCDMSAVNNVVSAPRLLPFRASPTTPAPLGSTSCPPAGPDAAGRRRREPGKCPGGAAEEAERCECV